MQYPLQEEIGNPDLFVGRERELQNFRKWLRGIPKRISKSRMILARRKSGKTAFVQRLFNELWSQGGEVIPFYFSIAENKIWYPDCAEVYYCTVAAQYFSFIEREPQLMKKPLSLDDIDARGSDFFSRNVHEIRNNRTRGNYAAMWNIASSAPKWFADTQDCRVLVILDEFQNLAQYIYHDEACAGEPDETMPGSFHSLVETKIAPMLVTGSYVGWLLALNRKYLQAGRLQRWRMTPYLTEEDGLVAAYRYAGHYDEPITNTTALQINQLCFSDPFFISCVMQNQCPDRDLTTEQGVIAAVNYEISERNSEMSETWREYLELTVEKINDLHGKHLWLHLTKQADRFWTPQELKDTLSLDISRNAIQERLVMLAEADMIERGASDIDFRGLQDGTLNLILRSRFEKEISQFVPDFTQEFQARLKALHTENKRLQGLLNHLSGQFAEVQLALALRAKKRFALPEFFGGVQDTTRLNIVKVQQRLSIQRDDGKGMELDVVAESSCGRIVVVEVKKWKDPIGPRQVEDFWEKAQVYATQMTDKHILPAFLALGGFQEPALRLCETHSIGTADRIAHF